MEYAKAAAPVRKVIALPSIEDLKRESERTGAKWNRETERAYASAQARMQMARMQMARAALAVVNPEMHRAIEQDRMFEVRKARRVADDKISEFFSETCNGGL
jgi:hypothetical protein